MTSLALTLDDDALDELAALVAARIAPASDTEPWIGVTEAAEHLACSRQRIYDLVSQNRIPYRKDGSRLLFKRSELDRALEAGL